MPSPTALVPLLAGCLVAGAAEDIAQHVECTSTAQPCECADGYKCGNTSTSKGVKNREDATSCCCPATASILFAASPAICQEVKKCTYDCCTAGSKLCGTTCCNASTKCHLGQCSSGSTTPPPQQPGSQRVWYELIPARASMRCVPKTGAGFQHQQAAKEAP
ncbi:unnamed protein product [Effrenium voratum]|nr:unnamed protein product [Effrenium voratum]